MARDLIIVGAGGHGREVFGLVQAMNEASVSPPWNVIGFVDDEPSDGENASRLARLRSQVIGAVEDLDRFASRSPVAVIAVGDPSVRRALAGRVAAAGVELAPALVHPTASVGPDVRLGQGVVVAAGSQVTTNVEAGSCVQVNVGCSLSHDVVVGDHATLSPGCRLTGGVEVGEGAFFGVGAVVGPRVRVGTGARVGAGAVVLQDVEDGVTVYGVPARPRSEAAR